MIGVRAGHVFDGAVAQLDLAELAADHDELTNLGSAVHHSVEHAWKISSGCFSDQPGGGLCGTFRSSAERGHSEQAEPGENNGGDQADSARAALE